MGHLRALGAVVGPKSTRCVKQEAEGFEISQMDVDDAVASEVFYMNRFTSRARSFGVHPVRWIYTGYDKADHETGVQVQGDGPPERKTWNRSRNLSTHKELLVVKCTYFSRQRQLRPCTPDRWCTSTTSFKKIPKRQFFQHKVFSRNFQRRDISVDPQRMVWHRVVCEKSTLFEIDDRQTLDAPRTNWTNFFVEIGHSQNIIVRTNFWWQS